MSDIFSRTEMLIGADKLQKLAAAKIAVFGIGGVGGYVVEALARCGVGNFVLIDNDTVNITNINRQIIATHDTVGQLKTEAMKKRIMSINPDIKAEVHNCFFLPENSDKFNFAEWDYIVDAVDTVTAKLEIIAKAAKNNIPVISCMGTGNKLDPTQLKISDINKTSVCPLARVMRRELKQRGIKKLKVLYSAEQPLKTIVSQTQVSPHKAVPGSISFVPSAAGLIIASEVVKDLLSI